MAIADLFAAGEPGGWWDCADLSTMFQDTAGTVPVTTAGQSVALWRDKSGNGNHASQATTSKRPTLAIDSNGRYYLAFDGVDDWLDVTIPGVGGNSDKTIIAAARHTTSSGSTVFHMGAASAAAGYGIGFGGTAGTFVLIQWSADISASGYSTATNYVHTGLKSGSTLTLRRGGIVVAGPTVVTAANMTVSAGRIGQRMDSAAPMSGRIYGLVLRGANTTGTTLTTAEADMAALMSVLSTGTASGTITITGTATGQALAQGTASGTVTITGTATAAALATGQAAGSVSITGTATGQALAQGQASGAVTITGAATGTAQARGTASGSVTISGAASGAALARGAASGVVSITGTATGTASGSVVIAPAAIAIPGRWRAITIPGAWESVTIAGAWNLPQIPGRWRAAA